MAINKNKVQLQETVLDSNGHPLSSTDVNPLTSSDCVIMENGMTLEDVMGNDTVIDTPTIMNEDTSFKVGIGDSETKVIDSDVAKMVIEGKTYQNILPNPTTLIMNTDEKEFKINDKIDNSIVLDDNVAEIATVKGQTYVNAVQEESASEYVAIGEELNGQSITTTGKPEGMVKNATLEGLTLVNTIQEPSGADATVLELDADIDTKSTTIDNTVQGGIHGAKLVGQTLINLLERFSSGCSYDDSTGVYTSTQNEWVFPVISTQNVKANIVYTLFAKVNTTSDYIYIRFDYNDGVVAKDSIINGNVTPNSDIFIKTAIVFSKEEKIRFVLRNAHDGVVKMSNIMLIEGDHTQEDIPYFEGMKSVEVPSVKTTGKNLIGGTGYYIGLTGTEGATGSNVLTGDGTLKRYSYISECKPNTTYTLTTAGTANRCGIGEFSEYPKLGVKGIKRGNSNNAGTLTITTQPTTNYLVCYCYYRETEHSQSEMDEIVRGLIVQLEEGSTKTTYEPHKTNILTVLSKTNLVIDSEKSKFYYYEDGIPDTTGGSCFDSYRANVEGLTSVYVKNTHSNYTFWDTNMNFISGVPFINELALETDSHSKDGIVKVPSNAKYMRFAYNTVENNGLPCVSEVIALRKVGDIQDELDLETGKLTQRIGEVVLDGSEDGWRLSGGNTNELRYGAMYPNSSVELFSKTLNDKFINGDMSKTDILNYIYATGSSNGLVVTVDKTKLETVDITGFKKWLSQNPITVQYQLATPIIKTVDLSIVDQDNNSIKSIQTHPTLTHVSTSSNGLTPFVTIPSQLKYPTIIKPSTTYTVQLKQTTVNSEFPLTINLGGTTMAVPSTKFTITTPETLTSQDVIFTGKNNVIGEVVITEGDTTGIEYDFFEGMNDVKSPKLLATGKNLFNFENGGQINGLMFSNNGANNYTVSGTCTKDNTDFYAVAKDRNNGTFTRLNSLPIGTKIAVSKSSSIGRQVFLSITQKDGSPTKYVQTYTTTNNDNVIQCFIRFMNGDTFDNAQLNLQIEIGSTATSYEPYKGVTIEQSIDSIPLTSDMFEQGGYSFNSTSLIRGMSLQQIPLFNSDTRIKTKTLIKLKPNSTYTINADVSFSYACFNKDGNYLKAFDFCSTFTTDSETHYIVMNLKYADDSTITPSSLDSLNLTLQEVTDEIVLRSIGDVKDTLNLTTGEYVQRIGEVVLDGKDKGDLCYTKYSMNDHETNTFTNTSVFCVWNIPNKRLGYNTSVTSSFSNCGTSSAFAPTQAKQGIYSDHTLLQNIYIDYGNNNNYTLQEFKTYLQTNPITLQYQLARPIIHKVNLTNTKVIPSYGTETHYETITPSDSLVPNIKIPSTIDYNVAIKPSTQYTVRCNTTDTLSVNLGGSEGTLANGKVTLTTPSTLAHNSLKLGSSGKAKEVMVIEGSEIKDNVPFFNGMKNVQMGGIKLVNIARLKKYSALVTANTNKTQFTYTSNGANAYHTIYFDTSLLKTNTVYTVFADITTNTSDNVQPLKFQFGNASGDILDVTRGFVGKIKQTITSANTTKDGLAIVFRPCTSGQQVVIQNPMVIEGDWTHLDEIPYIESEMIIEQPIIRSQGKNLLDLSQFETATDEGKEVVYIGDYKPNIKFKENTQYIVNFTSKYREGYATKVKIKHTDGSEVETVFSSTTFTKGSIASTQHKTVQYIQFWQNVNDTGLNCGVYVKNETWIEEGSTATSYEPFKHQTLYSNRVIGYEENCYHSCHSGAKITNTNANSMLADVEGLTVAYVTNGGSNFTFYDKDMVFISGKPYLDTGLSADNKNGFIQVPSNAKYMRFASGNKIDATTDYTKATVTGELPLRSLPNGVCDSFNLVTGEYVQRVGEIVLDGSQDDINYHTPADSELLTFRINALCNDGKVGENTIYATNLVNDSVSGLLNYPYSCRIAPYAIGTGQPSINRLFICVPRNVLETQDSQGFKQYLSQNPITVQYELETPIVRKIGLTAKGNYKESLAVNNLSAMVMGSYGDKTYRMQGTFQSDCYDDSPIFTDGYHVRHYPTDSHGEYEYIALIGNFIYINILKDGAYNDTIGRQWLSQHPIKVGYISTAQSSTSYSNILKPIFFNDAKVQFMNNNVDIQPTLTLQPRSRNSYVMDMMKANTRYTLKALANPNPFTIDGTSYNATTNGTFTSPSVLTNKLLITGQDVQELMIIEGDVTGKTIPYYKGIRSSFDNTDEIEIYSVNKNLFDISVPFTKDNQWSTIIDGNSVISTRIVSDGGAFGAGFRVNHVKPNTVYTLSWGSGQGQIFIYSNSGLWGTNIAVKNTNEGSSLTFTTKSDTKYITIGLNYGKYDVGAVLTTTNIKLEEGSVATPYQPYEENTTIINMPMQLETVEVVKVDRVKDMEIGAINHSSGANTDSSTAIRTKNYIPVQPSMQITYCNNNVERATHFMYYDINKNFIGGRVYLNGATNKGTVTTPDNCYFIRLYHAVTNVDNLTITKKQYKPIALNELPNGVKDELIINRATSSAKLIRRVGKVVLDGSEDWMFYGTNEQIKTTAFRFLLSGHASAWMSANGYCNKIVFRDGGYIYSTNNEGVTTDANNLIVRITNEKASTIDGIKQYLKRNPITVYYELAEPVITEIRLKGYPFIYEDGSISLNTDIAPVTRTSYNVNQHQLINSQNETIIRHDKQISDLYDYIEIYLDEIYRMELFKMQLELSL